AAHVQDDERWIQLLQPCGEPVRVDRERIIRANDSTDRQSSNQQRLAHQCLPGSSLTPRRSHAMYASIAVIFGSSAASGSPSNGLRRHQFTISHKLATLPNCF